MQAPPGGLSIDGVLTAIQRHRFKAGVTFLVTLALTVLLILLVPRKYYSEAKLFVRLGRETVSLDPTATTGSMISVLESRETEINSVRDLLQTRTIMEQTVDKLGAEFVLGLDTEENAVGWSLPSNDSPRELAIRALEKSIEVESGRKSSVLSVSTKASSPELAQQILEEYLKAYKSLHTNANRTEGGHEFFVSQANILQKQLDDALAELQAVKDQSDVITIEASQENLQEQLNVSETKRLEVHRDIMAVDATIATQKRQLLELPPRLVTEETDGLPNVAADTMRQTLYELQIQERELLAQRTADHPMVSAVRKKIEDSQAILDLQEKQRVQSKSDINPAAQEIQINLVEQQALAAALAAELDTLNEQIASLHQRRIALNEAEVRIRRLEQTAAIAESTYGQYREYLEQTRIGDALQLESISNVNIVQPPSFVTKPVSPNRKLMLAAGMLAAIAGSILISIVWEWGFPAESHPMTRGLDTHLTTKVARSKAEVRTREGILS